jgi:hypothetical protein
METDLTQMGETAERGCEDFYPGTWKFIMLPQNSADNCAHYSPPLFQLACT